MSAVTTTYNVIRGYTPPGAFWQLSTGVLAPNGQPVPQSSGMVLIGSQLFNIPVSRLPQSCAAPANGASSIAPSCRAALDSYRGFITYQPASRFWAFQGIETGVFVLLAAILLAVTAAVLLRRDP